METAVEIIWNVLKFLGIVGGLVSPVVLAYDRLMRNRPLISFSATYFTTGRPIVLISNSMQPTRRS
jgi:hypothetical protein